MKKLIIEFKSGTRITYTMNNSDDHMEQFNIYDKRSMKSAILQQYPKKKNEPIKLV